MKYLRTESGQVLPSILALMLMLSALGVALAAIAVSNNRSASQLQKSQSAFNIAEAGINYYLWHLSHNSTDYTDGSATIPGSTPYGPYTHDYDNDAGTKIGTFSLYITPPVSNSTVTTVKSVGVALHGTGTRTVQAQLGIPSFASYALLTNSEIWFGPTESSNGPVLSNVGIRFDGTNDGPVESATSTYVPSTASGTNGTTTEPGVWGTGGPQSQWQFPVPAVDFNQVTADLQALQTSAQSNGVYLAPTGTFSASHGYEIVLKNNKTFDIYKVTNVVNGTPTTTFVRNQAAPANGLLYVADNVWVQGTWNGRMTIASGRLPDVSSTDTTITIIGNVSYTALDGSVALGLIAQQDVDVSSIAPNNLTIDGALLAQKGAVIYPYSGGIVKNNLTFYGSIATNQQWTWNYVSCGSCTTVIDGYKTDTNTFDTNLTFSPPPSFPTTGAYSVLNWRELLSNP